MSTYEQLVLSTNIFLLSVLLGWRCIAAPSRVRTSDLVILFTGAWFGLGPWIHAGLSRWSLPAYDAGLLMKAYMGVALYLSGLAFGGWISRRRAKDISLKTLASRATSISEREIIATLVFTTAVRIYAGVRYGIFFSGTGTKEAIQDLPYWLVTALAITSFLEAGAMVWGSVAIFNPGKQKKKYSAVAVLLLLLMIAFLQGRRWVLQLGLLVVFFGMAFGRRYAGRWSFRKTASVVTVLALLATFPVFLALRNIYYADQYYDQPTGNAVVQLFDATQRLTASFSWDLALKESRENMAVRLDYIGPICTIEASQAMRPLMYGWATLYSLLFSLPRVIYSHKTVTPKTEVSMHYGVMYIDWSNTMVAYGISDGGLLGAAVMGVLLAIVVGYSERWAVNFMSEAKLVSIAVAGNLFALAWNVESDPSNVGNLIKLSLFCLFLWWIGRQIRKR